MRAEKGCFVYHALPLSLHAFICQAVILQLPRLILGMPPSLPFTDEKLPLWELWKLAFKHEHTCIHTHTYSYLHAHTLTLQQHTLTHTCIHKHISSAHTHAEAHTRTHEHSYSHTCINTCERATLMYTCKHTLVHIHAHTGTHRHVPTGMGQLGFFTGTIGRVGKI